MDITEIQLKKHILKEEILRLLKEFCEETGMQFTQKNTIQSFYDVDEIKGRYVVGLNVLNPIL